MLVRDKNYYNTCIHVRGSLKRKESDESSETRLNQQMYWTLSVYVVTFDTHVIFKTVTSTAVFFSDALWHSHVDQRNRSGNHIVLITTSKVDIFQNNMVSHAMHNVHNEFTYCFILFLMKEQYFKFKSALFKFIFYEVFEMFNLP